MQQCATTYTDLCGEPDMELRSVETPFLAWPDGGGMALLLSKRAVKWARCNPLLVRS